MKILIVGEWRHPMYERSIARAFNTLGHQVSDLPWYPLFSGALGRLETKFCLDGPQSRRFNVLVIDAVAREMPDVILFWRATQLRPQTLRAIKSPGRILASYNHDDFSGPGEGAPVPYHHRRLWRLFLECAPLFDVHFVKREANIAHLSRLGARRAFITPMWFDPEIHRPVSPSAKDLAQFGTDVVFAGHYEPDGREKSILALMDAGIKVKVWGCKYWTERVLGTAYSTLQPIRLVEGEEYTKALCAAKICLAFLSKLNRDTYTRRCFEIPACGKILLSERTDELTRMFKEDEEACFFSSPTELVAKVRWLLANPEVREKIAKAGMRRVWADGHDVVSRARNMLTQVVAPV